MQNKINSLEIKYIKITFFDIKVVNFILKVANCKKYARRKARSFQVKRVNFWKNLAGRGDFLWKHLRPRRCNAGQWTVNSGLRMVFHVVFIKSVADCDDFFCSFAIHY